MLRELDKEATSRISNFPSSTFLYCPVQWQPFNLLPMQLSVNDNNNFLGILWWRMSHAKSMNTLTLVAQIDFSTSSATVREEILTFTGKLPESQVTAQFVVSLCNMKWFFFGKGLQGRVFAGTSTHGLEYAEVTPVQFHWKRLLMWKPENKSYMNRGRLVLCFM